MKILWLKTELLHPVDKGGKIRTYNMLKELKRDHQITYLTLDDGEDETASAAAFEYCHELITIPHRARAKFTMGFYFDLLRNLVSSQPYAISKYKSRSMERATASLVRDGNFDVVVCDFLTPAINLDLDVDCPTALFQHNVEAMIWKRHYQVATNPLKKLYLFGQWLKMRAFERTACRQFNVVVAVSAEDREQMKVTVLTTLQCNFACDYCFQGDHGDYNKFAAKMTLEQKVQQLSNDVRPAEDPENRPEDCGFARSGRHIQGIPALKHAEEPYG